MTTSARYRRSDLQIPSEEARAIFLTQLPPPPCTGAVRWSWTIRDAEGLADVRHDLRARATQAEARARDAEPSRAVDAFGATDGPLMARPVERLLLVFSELATNGLRHAVPPVDVTVTRAEDGWLVVVSDASVEAGPHLHRTDPRRPGQHGLIVVAALSAASGWFADRDCKHVWAAVPDLPPATLLHQLASP